MNRPVSAQARQPLHHPSPPETARSPDVPVITDAVITRLQPALLRAAMRMVQHRETAEDVVQETWISALHSVHAYEGRASLTTWLIAILRRRVFDLRRGAGPRTQPLEDEEHAVDLRLTERVDARARVAQVSRALPSLSERERTALVLCDLRYVPRSEVAAQLRVSPEYVRVLLHRARGRMREAVTPRETRS